MSASTQRDRALGSFYGLALGDALGMPTQAMSRSAIQEDYGAITTFRDAGPRQRIAAGMAAGSITDDTEQAMLLARLLIEGDGTFAPHTFAQRLIAWEKDMEARGSLDLLGPSTKAAVDRLTAGEPVEQTGRFGTTNGAAMRITPVGISVALPGPAADSLASFVDAVARASEVTHNTGLGISGASAIGAAVSAGIAGASLPAAIEAAIAAAAEGETRGNWVAGGSISARIGWAADLLAPLDPAARIDAACDIIGTSVASQESVVAALALASVSTNPWDTLCLCASVGGDTDTIGAMAGAVLGAVFGMRAWPEREVAILKSTNHISFETMVDELLALRR